MGKLWVTFLVRQLLYERKISGEAMRAGVRIVAHQVGVWTFEMMGVKVLPRVRQLAPCACVVSSFRSEASETAGWRSKG